MPASAASDAGRQMDSHEAAVRGAVLPGEACKALESCTGLSGAPGNDGSSQAGVFVLY
jgi:hypothetical protein